MLPGELTIDVIEGSVLSPITVFGLSFKNSDFSFQVERVQVEWEPQALLDARIHIIAIALDKPHFSLLRTTSSTPGLVINWDALGIKLTLDKARLVNGQFSTHAAAPIDIQSASISGQVDEQQIIVSQLNMESSLFTFSGNGKIQRKTAASPEDSVNAHVTWSARPQGMNELAGAGELHGLWNALTLSHDVNKPFDLHTDLTLRQLASNPSWQAQSSTKNLAPAMLNAAWPTYALAAEMKAHGDGTIAHFSTDLRSKIAPFGETVAHFTGQIDDLAQLALHSIHVKFPKKNMSIDAEGGVLFSNQSPLFGLRGKWKNLRWPVESDSQVSIAESANGTFELSGSPEKYKALVDATFTAQLLTPLAQHRPWHAQLAFTGDLDKRWDISRAELASTESGARLSAAGNVRMRQGEPVWDIYGAWRDVALPIKQTVAQSHYGRYQSKGAVGDYQLNVDTSVTLPNAIAATAIGTFHGNQNGFDSAKVKIQGLEGELTVNGALAWRPALSWNVDLHVDDVNPAAIWQDWPGKLTGDATFQGNFVNDVLNVDVSRLNMDGVLRSIPFEMQATGDWQANRLRLKSAHLVSGSAVADASGIIGPVNDFHVAVNAPDLSALVPGAKGSLIAQTTVSGSNTALALTGSLHSEQLSFGRHRAAELDSHWDIDLVNHRESFVAVAVTGAVLADQSIGKIDIRLAGSTDAQSVSANIRNDELSVDVGATGHWQNEHWQGEVAHAAMTHSQLGTWELQDAFSLDLAAAATRIDRACFASNESRICAHASWDATRTLSGSVEASRFDVRAFSRWLPNTLRWNGTLDGSAQWTLAPGVAPIVTANLIGNTGTIALEDDQFGVKPLAYSNATATLISNTSGPTLNWDASFAGQGAVNGTLSLPNFNALQVYNPEQAVTGSVHISWQDLTPLATLFPLLDSPEGKMELTSSVTGTISKPLFDGSASISDASVGLPELGTHLTDIQILGQSDGPHTLRVKGSARSGEGRVTVTGQAKLDPEKGWPTQLHFSGDTFELVRKPGMWLHVSPELDLNIALPDISIEGDLTIAKGTFESKDSSSIVYPSSDVTITGASLTPRNQAARRINVRYNVRTLLGKRVNFEAYGLTGRLEGSVLVRREPGQVTTGIGEVTIQDGRYRFYGSELEISRGRLIFASGPATNPDVDIRASRVIEDPLAPATVGVQASGRIKEPVFTLFSTPTMEDTNILSYLLLGRPVLQADSSEAEFLANAVSAITLTRGYEMAKRLAVTLGIEDTRLNNRGLFLGRAISPRLYMSYEIGLFEPSNTLQLKYSLTQHWQLKTESGRYNMADILYTVEH